MSSIYYNGSDMVIELNGLYDNLTGSYINTATVTVTLYDDNDVEIPGEVWPLTMSYVASSDGIYRATLLAAIDSEAQATGKAVINVSAGANTLVIEEELDFVTRSSDTPDKSSVTITCYGHDGEIEEGVVIHIEQLTIPTSNTNRAFDGHLRMYTSDANGEIDLVLWRNAQYRYRRGLSTNWVTFTPNTANYSVTSVVGL